jgi:hypothetical protein
VPNRIAGTATSATTPQIGVYVVGFARSVAGCATVANLARIGNDVEPPAGRITVETTMDGKVLVHTYNENGAPGDYGFHLIVICD